jgi:prolyl oligopeptidase
MTLQNPAIRKSDQIDNYHGTLILDPFFWLENVDSLEILEWMRQQNELTFSYLEKFPARECLTTLWDYPIL